MSKNKKPALPAAIKSGPEDVARVMRKEALKNTGKDPSFRIYRGWKFGLSYGPPPVPTREVWEKLAALPGGLASIITRFGFKAPEDLSYDAFLQQHEAAKKIGAESPAKNEWICSASLHPRGRSSVREDWRFFGEMMAAIGAPQGSLVTPLETTDPNAVHYCIWREEPSGSGSRSGDSRDEEWRELTPPDSTSDAKMEKPS